MPIQKKMCSEDVLHLRHSHPCSSLPEPPADGSPTHSAQAPACARAHASFAALQAQCAAAASAEWLLTQSSALAVEEMLLNAAFAGVAAYANETCSEALACQLQVRVDDGAVWVENCAEVRGRADCARAAFAVLGRWPLEPSAGARSLARVAGALAACGVQVRPRSGAGKRTCPCWRHLPVCLKISFTATLRQCT